MSQSIHCKLLVSYRHRYRYRDADQGENGDCFYVGKPEQTLKLNVRIGHFQPLVSYRHRYRYRYRYCHTVAGENGNDTESCVKI